MLKIALLYIFSVNICTPSFCQSDDKYPALIGIQFIQNDFKKVRRFGNFSKMDAGLSLHFLKGYSPHFDYRINLAGSFPDSISKKIPVTKKSLLLQGDAAIRARLFGKNKWFQPFLSSGIGAGTYKGYWNVYFSVGPGVEFSYKDVYLTTAVQYRPALLGKLNTHYFYSVGISGAISRPKKKKEARLPMQAPIANSKDTDGDGILDTADACPLVPGLLKFKGCPDTDNDGLEDKVDKCPSVFGFERYEGCPIPDTDKDGINDEQDSCLSIPGVTRYRGCPIPDKDGDGVNDEMDSCINIPGLKENKGCPLIDKGIKEKIDLAAKNIFFKTGSYELLPESFASLDEVVKILKENPTVSLTIEGHTDNVGLEVSNQILSEKRAYSVLKYLAGKNIDKSRLAAFGYGQLRSIDTNDTKQGRSKNRRVELKPILSLSR